MKAVLDGVVIAEATDDEIITIEGNSYFPPSSVDFSKLAETDTPYTCPWKGACQYYSVSAGGDALPDRAWAYPHPYPSAFDRVGRDFSGYVAFWKEVSVED